MSPLILLLSLGAGLLAVVLLAKPVVIAVGWVLGQVGRFVIGELVDALRLIGAIVTLAVLVPLALLGILAGRWSAAGHFWRAIRSELRTCGLSLYRIVVGHPVRLFKAETLTEGIESRLPAVMKATPGADHPPKRVGQFEGYTIIGSLAGGGSGGKLYIAEPDEVRRASFERQGLGTLTKVVIKSFSLRDGSTLPQIIRESRALDAAKKLGLVLEHELTDERFFYVMRFIPGDSLGLVTQRMHGSEASGGLDGASLARALGFMADLLGTLDVYHRGGLWHKDVKPDNIIVEGGSAHLVDFGLVTPLRSAMTLTTHGTEYFRDPELVRMALKGVKVHQVDGAKFDLYAAGAVLFSVMENSFPAHGGLSQITKRCPDAVRWIVRRAMADYDKRYETAAAMLADIQVVRQAPDPFALKPIDLPSMGGDAPDLPAAEPAHHAPPADEPAQPATATAPRSKPPRRPRSRVRPRLSVVNWWTGRYHLLGKETVPGAKPRMVSAAVLRVGFGSRSNKAKVQRAGTPSRVVPVGQRRPAKEQVQRARARAQQARTRVHHRRRGLTQPEAGSSTTAYKGGVSGPVAMGVGALTLGALGVGLFFVIGSTNTANSGSPGSAANTAAQTSTLNAGIGAVTPAVGDTTPPAPIDPAQPGQTTDDPAQAGPGGLPGLAMASALAGGAAISSNTNVLIVNEFDPPLEPRVRAAVERLEQDLRREGMRVLGNTLSPTDPDRAGMEADLLAEVHAVRQLRSLDSRATVAEISAWIGRTPSVDYIVWVHPDETDAGKPVLDPITYVSKTRTSRMFIEAMRKALVDQIVANASEGL